VAPRPMAVAVPPLEWPTNCHLLRREPALVVNLRASLPPGECEASLLASAHGAVATRAKDARRRVYWRPSLGLSWSPQVVLALTLSPREETANLTLLARVA